MMSMELRESAYESAMVPDSARDMPSCSKRLAKDADRKDRGAWRQGTSMKTASKRLSAPRRRAHLATPVAFVLASLEFRIER